MSSAGPSPTPPSPIIPTPNSSTRITEYFTLADRPELIEATFAIADEGPTFMRGDETGTLFSDAAPRWYEWTLAFVDDGAVVARAVTVPLSFPDEYRTTLPESGMDGALRWAAVDALNGTAPNAACALEITVDRQRRNEGLSAFALRAVLDLARSRGLTSVICPVRPTEKSAKPRMRLEEYIGQLRDDGLPTDPWLRTHVRAGGEVAGIAPFSMVVHASLDRWREWTGLPFDSDGPTDVPNALYPVDVSLALDRAVYVEPNVWVVHRL